MIIRVKRAAGTVSIGTWQAIFTDRSSVSNDRIPAAPDSLFNRRFQTFSTPVPSGVTAPTPVTTTRLNSMAMLSRLLDISTAARRARRGKIGC